MFIKLFLLSMRKLHIKSKKDKNIFNFKDKGCEKMKKTIGKVLLTVVISAILVVAISSASFGSDIGNNQSQNPQGQNVGENVSDPAYIIGIYKGYVAVYKYGNDKPFKVTNVPVSSLTQGDVVILEKGIRVADDDELNKRLEDYVD